MDLFQGTCHEFGKVFSEDLASFEEIDDKIQHHAEGLTNCFKLVQSNPESPSVQTLWMWLIRCSVKLLLWIDSTPSKDCLELFIETIKPWLVDGNFRGFCYKELLDIYDLAVKGPWSHPTLQRLLDGEDVSVDELLKVFDEGLPCVEFHMSSLIASSKSEQFLLFSKAAFLHPQVSKNKCVQKMYQEHVRDIFSEEEFLSQMKDFDFGVTVSILEECIKSLRQCDTLCSAAVKYLFLHNELKFLEEILSCWIKLIESKHPFHEMIDILRKDGLESDPSVSVQQCVVLARVLWKVVGEKARMMCVEILCRALELLSADEQDSDELKNGILTSIAYFLPNSQVARACILTSFILNPTVDHYFEVAKIYKIPYDRDKDTAIDLSANLRLSLLEHLHQQWPQSFLQSSSWDWPLLRNVCHNMLSHDDLATVHSEEQEAESREASANPIDESNETSSTSEVTHSEESSLEPKCSATKQTPVASDHDASEPNTSGSGDLCDCVACQIKTGKQPVKEQSVSTEHAGKTKKLPPTKPSSKPGSTAKRDSSHRSSQKKDTNEAYFVCPEESCQRSVKSKNGMSKHLSKTHRWSLNEIHGYYMAVDNQNVKPSARAITSGYKPPTKPKAVPSNEENAPAKPDPIQTPEKSPESIPPQLPETNSTTPAQEIPETPVSDPQAVTPPARMDEPMDAVSSGDRVSPLPAENSDHGSPLPAENSDRGSPLPAENSDRGSPLPTENFDRDSPPPTENFDRSSPLPAENFEMITEAAITLQTNEQTAVSEENKVEDSLPENKIADVLQQPEPLTAAPFALEPLPTQKPPVMPSLPPIFNTDVEMPAEPEAVVTEEPVRECDLLIACPAKHCDRVYKHRHTVKEHLEFRHKINPEKAAKMAQTAEYVDDSAPPPPPSKKSDLTAGLGDIRNSRGWYWSIDEFLGKEVMNRVVRHNPSVEQNFVFALECDIIYTLGRAPLSYSSDSMAKDIIKKWKFAEKYREVEKPPAKKSKVKAKPFTTVSVSHKLLKKTSAQTQKYNESSVKLTGYSKTHAKKVSKDEHPFPDALKTFPKKTTKEDRYIPPELIDPIPLSDPTNDFDSDPEPETSDKSCQTIMKMSKFSKSDHYHNFPEVKNKKLKRKKSDNPVAITIIAAGSYVSRKSRTIASQCCQSDIKAIPAIPDSTKKPAPVKRKASSTDVFSQLLFSTNEEPVVPPAIKQVKRKYDAQTVYHLADNNRTETLINNNTHTNNNNKPSFADALNSMNKSAVNVDKPKQKRKSSKQSLEIIKIDESPSFQKPRVTAPAPSRSNSTSGEAPAKKHKTKKSKNRSLSSTFVKKHSVSSDVVVRKRVDDISRQLFPSHDYEQLLKHAEELSSSVKTKPSKVSKHPLAKNPSTPSPASQSTVAPTANITKPKPLLRKSPVREAPLVPSKKKEPLVTSTPIIAPDDDDGKKKAHKPGGKRRIDLRKLISSTKPDATPISREIESSSLDESLSSAASYNPDAPIEEMQASISAVEFPPDTSDPNPANQSENTEIVCPECSKPMSSAFALTCHMRKRHKGRSKKMFFPGQSLDSSHSSTSSTASSKNTTKPPKNVLEPPEGTEACSATASFGSARVETNASDFSDSDSDSKSRRASYSADVSALSQTDLSDFIPLSDTEAVPAVSAPKFAKAAVPTAAAVPPKRKSHSSSKPAVSIPFSKYIAGTVDTAGPRSVLQTGQSPKEMDMTGTGPVYDISSQSASSDHEPIQPSISTALPPETLDAPQDLPNSAVIRKNIENPVSEFSVTHPDSTEVSELMRFIVSRVDVTLSEKNITSQKQQSIPVHLPEKYIEQRDNFFICAMPHCHSKCRLKKSIKEHFKKKHFIEFTEIWGSTSVPVVTQTQSSQSASSTKKSRSKSRKQSRKKASKKAYAGLSEIRESVSTPNPETPQNCSSTTASTATNHNGEDFIPSAESLSQIVESSDTNDKGRDEKESVRNAESLSQSASSATDNRDRDGEDFVASAKSSAQNASSATGENDGKDSIRTAESSSQSASAIDDKGSDGEDSIEETDEIVVQSREPPVRRTAYTEASLQIQLSSINLSPRKQSHQQELMRLYNKRVRSKIAQALSPAARLARKTELTDGKLFKKRKRKDSGSSTDSYDADYDAQLPCWGCDAMFHCRKNLTRHVQHHIKYIDLYAYRCEYPGCLYAYKTWDLLQAHSLNHNSATPNICLFCPNQCRSFRSFRKLVKHEFTSHPSLTIDMLRFRKAYCLNVVRGWGKPWNVEKQESSESESFLAPGHRRVPVDNRRCCAKCAKKKNADFPSVAAPCKHVIKNNVKSIMHDLLETITEYERICAKESSTSDTTDQSVQPPISNSESSSIPETGREEIPTESFFRGSGIRSNQERSFFESGANLCSISLNTAADPANAFNKSFELRADDTSPIKELFQLFSGDQFDESYEVASTCDDKLHFDSDVDDRPPTEMPALINEKLNSAQMDSSKPKKIVTNSLANISVSETNPETSRSFSISYNGNTGSNLNPRLTSTRLLPSTNSTSAVSLESGEYAASSCVTDSDVTSDEQAFGARVPPKEYLGLILTSPAKRDLATLRVKSVQTYRDRSLSPSRPKSDQSHKMPTTVSNLSERYQIDVSPYADFPMSSSILTKDPCILSSSSIDKGRNVYTTSVLPSAESNHCDLEPPTSLQKSDSSYADHARSPPRSIFQVDENPPVSCSILMTPPKDSLISLKNVNLVVSPPRHSEFTGFDYDILLESLQVVHKLISDVEIEDQADYMRSCGFIPTGVMYYKQCDLKEDHGVGLSVFGYNSEAFKAMDMALGRHVASLPAPFDPSVLEAGQDQRTPISDDQPCTSKHASSVQTASSARKDEISPLSSNLPLLPLGLPGFGPSLPQPNFMSNYINRECHPMWRLDADETYSKFCDISSFDPFSRALFCQHYVVPSRFLNLLPPPLSGMSTPYPVTTDEPRYAAYSCRPYADASNDMTTAVKQLDVSFDQNDVMNSVSESPILLQIESGVEYKGLEQADAKADIELSQSAFRNQLALEEQDNLSTDVEPGSQSSGACSDPKQDNIDAVTENEENIDPKASEEQFSDQMEEQECNSTASSVEQALTPVLGDNPFFDSFMDDFRIEKEKNSKKGKKKTNVTQQPMLGSAKIFKARGRPRKSYDLMTFGFKSGMRRSMSEIVAFCDSPAAAKELYKAHLPINKKSAKKVKPSKAKKNSPVLSPNMNPVVSIDALSVSSLKSISGVSNEKIMLRNDQSEELEVSSKEDSQNEGADSMSVENLPETDETTEQSSEITVSECRETDDEPNSGNETVFSENKDSEVTVEVQGDNESNMNSTDMSVSPSDLEDSFPQAHIPPARCVLLDHCYAMALDSTQNPIENANEMPAVEINDYCEEVMIEQSSQSEKTSTLSPGEQKSAELLTDETNSQTSEPIALSSASDLSHSETMTSNKTFIKEEPTSSSQLERKENQPNPIAPTKSVESRGMHVPCIFCTEWFPSVEECKQHFRVSHTEQVLHYKREAKKLMQQPRRGYSPTLVGLTSSRRRYVKSIASEIGKRSIRPIYSKKSSHEKSLTGQSCSVGTSLVSPSPKSDTPFSLVIKKKSNTLMTPVDKQTSGGMQAQHAVTGVQKNPAKMRKILSEPTREYVSLPDGVQHPISISVRTTPPTSNQSRALVDQNFASSISTSTFKASLQPQQPHVTQIHFSFPTNSLSAVSQPISSSPSLSMIKRPVTKSCAIVAPTFRNPGSASSSPRSSDSSNLGLNLTPSPSNRILGTSVPQQPSIPHRSPLLQGTFSHSNPRNLPRVPLPLSYRPIGATKGVIYQSSAINSGTSLSVTSTPTNFNPSTQAIKVTTTDILTKKAAITLKELPIGSLPIVKQVYRISPIADLVSSSKSVNVSSSCNNSTPNIAPISDVSIANNTSSEPGFSRSLDSLLSSLQPDQTSPGSSETFSASSSSSSILDQITPHPIMASSKPYETSRQQPLPCNCPGFDRPTHQDFLYCESEDDTPQKVKVQDSNCSRRPTYCHICSICFRNMHDIKVHMLLVHSLHLCAIKRCQKLLLSSNDLERHQRRDHQPISAAASRRRSFQISTEMTLHEPEMSESDDDDSYYDDMASDTSYETDQAPFDGSSSPESLPASEDHYDIIKQSDLAWNKDLSSATFKIMHDKLISKMETMSTEQLLRYVFFEVKNYVKRCRVSKLSVKYQPYFHCPLSSCKVKGDKQFALYRHFFQFHKLSEILKWIRKRDGQLAQLRNLREKNRREKSILDAANPSAQTKKSSDRRRSISIPIPFQDRKRLLSQSQRNIFEHSILAAKSNSKRKTSYHIDGDNLPRKKIVRETVPLSANPLAIAPESISAAENTPRRFNAVIEITSLQNNDISAANGDGVSPTHKAIIPSASLNNSNLKQIPTTTITDSADRSFKCRFSECGKTIGDQSQFSCHMLTHSPSRIGWHEEEGKRYPLFNPVVLVNRRDAPSVIFEQGDQSSALAVRSPGVISRPPISLRIAKTQGTNTEGASSGLDQNSSPLSSPSNSSSPKTPLVVLKKLTSFS